MDAWQEEQLHILLSTRCEERVFEALAAAARALGFDFCAYGLRMPLPLTRPKTVVMSNYPVAWQKLYQERNYLETDPSVIAASRSCLPTIWSDELFTDGRELWDNARSFGLNHGWAQFSATSDGVRGMLTLARTHEALSPAELKANTGRLIWLAQLAHAGMTRCLGGKLQGDHGLSSREIEVLRWTAEGKTASEISQILGISERTVNFHVNNATAKLNANNKTAAVVRAVVLGLLG